MEVITVKDPLSNYVHFCDKCQSVVDVFKFKTVGCGDDTHREICLVCLETALIKGHNEGKRVEVNQKVLWAVELRVECPHCHEEFDYFGSDEWDPEKFSHVEVCQENPDIETACIECEKLFRFDVESGT